MIPYMNTIAHVFRFRRCCVLYLIDQETENVLTVTAAFTVSFPCCNDFTCKLFSVNIQSQLFYVDTCM